MKDFGSTLLVGTPSYALYLAETAERLGVGRDELKLRLGMFGGEGITEAMRAEIESRLGISATQNYGLSEIVGPGVSGECECKCGQHINEDCFYPEIINPQTGEVLPIGETGELVLTTINKEGLPMLRYRTKDITYLIEEKCACGRTTLRHASIQGRSDDMLIIKGVNVFPSQIESVLLDLGMDPNYRMIVDRKNNLDTLEVQVEMNESLFSDTVRNLEKVERTIADALHSTLNIAAKITLLEPKSIQRSEGKAKRVIDKRSL